MNKLKLNLDDLKVQSFETSSIDNLRGTVKGNCITRSERPTGGGCETGPTDLVCDCQPDGGGDTGQTDCLYCPYTSVYEICGTAADSCTGCPSDDSCGGRNCNM